MKLIIFLIVPKKTTQNSVAFRSWVDVNGPDSGGVKVDGHMP